MENIVQSLFDRYESFFRKSLEGEIDLDEASSLYAPEFIAASPAGVMAGRNDDRFWQAMMLGHERYRDIGTREMRIRHTRISPIDDLHCVAHVAWTATYARKDQADMLIEFDVHYLVQILDGVAKVFGWVSGNEQELLKQYGVT